MTGVLEIVGLIALVVAACLIGAWLGLAAFGGGCLLASWSITRKKRLAIEAERVRQSVSR